MPPGSPTARISRRTKPELATTADRGRRRGITCQKLGEAEVMADGGIDDILISYNILGEQKLGAARRAAAPRPHDRGRRQFAVTSRACRRPRRPPAARSRVVVECDTGRKRAGVETPGGGGRAGARDRGVDGTALRRLPDVSDRERLGANADVLDDGQCRPARRRAGRRHGLDRRLAEHPQRRQAQGRDRAPRRHLDLQRPHAGRGRRRDAGTIARSASTPRWSAGPARSAAFSIPARRR